MSPLRRISPALIALALLVVVAACQPATRSADAETWREWQRRTPEGPWHQGVGYSLFVRSFVDSDGDGKGDLRGAAGKLGYLAELGVRNVWVLPVNPSPTYHKYDVTDYTGIDTTYGSALDFERFVAEAHRRGIRITMDLVVNHCSNQHPWFRAAVSDTSSPYHDWFVWQQPGDTAKRNWHRLRDRPELPKYYGFFWRGMPDLNFDHPPVRREMIRIARYWLDRGVDGFRLDAALHIYDHLTPEGRAKSVGWWREFRDSVKASHPQAYLIGEVWAHPTVVRQFYDALDGCFNFGLAEAMVQQTLTGRDTSGLIARQVAYQSSLPQGTSDCVFLSNHDQVRIATRLKGNHTAMKQAASLLMAQPGMPWLYYGEELGMTGSKPDPRIREPFVWGDAAITAKWIRPKHSVPDSVPSLREQQADTTSIYAHYRRVIAQRNSIRARVSN